MKKELIIVRGGGDLATGTIHRLWSAGFPVLVLETTSPAAIRRRVAVSEAVYDGSTVVEGMCAVKISSAKEAEAVIEAGKVPVLVDPAGTSIPQLSPAVIVDAILAKRNMGTHRQMAPLTIALGPGFEAGRDVDVVIETKRGHHLGRIYRNGYAAPDTGVPGVIAGYGAERVIHAPEAGIIHTVREIGDRVERGEEMARIIGPDGTCHPVTATIPGILRGIIRDGYPVTRGFKLADIDPRESEQENCDTISDKARCIAGSVLEVVVAFINSGSSQ